jgi:hypothetical protein
MAEALALCSAAFHVSEQVGEERNIGAFPMSLSIFVIVLAGLVGLQLATRILVDADRSLPRRLPEA